jgi:hypothetical protein
MISALRAQILGTIFLMHKKSYIGGSVRRKLHQLKRILKLKQRGSFAEEGLY